MNWFGGNVVEAIQLSKSRKSLFLVCITGNLFIKRFWCVDNCTNYGFFAPLPFRPFGLFAPWLVRPLADLPIGPGSFTLWLVRLSTLDDSPSRNLCFTAGMYMQCHVWIRLSLPLLSRLLQQSTNWPAVCSSVTVHGF